MAHSDFRIARDMERDTTGQVARSNG